MKGDAEFEARLWRISSRVWVGVAVAALIFAIMSIATASEAQ